MGGFAVYVCVVCVFMHACTCACVCELLPEEKTEGHYFFLGGGGGSWSPGGHRYLFSFSKLAPLSLLGLVF